MDFIKEVLVKALTKDETHVTFPNLTLNVAEIVESESFNALQKIKAIVENDSLDDFMCIEEIVRALENIGSNGGNRHDFG